MNKITKFDYEDDNKELGNSESDIEDQGNEFEDEEENIEEEDDDISDFDDEKLPVLRSIVKKGRINVPEEVHVANPRTEDEERQAIKEELSSLSFEELQKLKEKIGSKKFNQTVNGRTKEGKPKVEFKRANPNRPREMSSKSRRIEPITAVQVPKVFRNDPRFDNLCGEFREKKFHKNYEFVYKMKEQEVRKLKEELQEEANPRRIEKIKYLIQRMENQIRSEKKRKEEEEKLEEERKATIEALKEGKSPYFATKAIRKERDLKEKFEGLKKEGKLSQYMAKKRKHNAQRDRRHMPSVENWDNN
uniref:rRNA biogenesis protein RRP36 n=1 Tax=Scapholeberis mucronata TaxID=202097 RepID=A0A4Y7NKW9_9CRUS|nr:EOG090X0E8U [Scapholeberis mucronata]SVE93899.1 EOG090X0E8U [Scapholeberis mucronata]